MSQEEIIAQLRAELDQKDAQNRDLQAQLDDVLARVSRLSLSSFDYSKTRSNKPTLLYAVFLSPKLDNYRLFKIIQVHGK